MVRRTTKKQGGELEGQSDPKAALEWQRFLQAAVPVMKVLKDDLRARAKGSVAVSAALTARHATDKANKRTADSFVEWQDRFIEQVAAAWMLSCVFVRTLEDRGLLGHNRLAGPGAADSLKLFLELAPSLNERDYLLTIFRELTRFAATRGLFDARHNPVWLLTPSAEGAKALVQLFQSPHADAPAFRFGQADTAFLGWIYQDLDEGVRERFALLQTPRFVEAFILDRTLEPALATFGLNDTTLIDPTCGSGHFLLGAFERLFTRHMAENPANGQREAARKALSAIHGADLNPYAVAIARFRLTLAFFDKAGFTRLIDAPALPLNVVVADSLLHNPFVQQGDLADFAPSAKTWRGQEYNLEDETEARKILFRHYAAVVGNPPYITVKDAVLRDRYRTLYPRSAAMNYSVAAPFTERFFQLARVGGRIGMITANSFMKREFGKKLIEQYLPRVNLDLVINTSGAYIPGHGTPTVLLFGSHEDPRGAEVATVLASRGEPSTPADAEQGQVWRSIADHWGEAGFENEYISVVRMGRETLAKHPWSLGGGGAAELKELLEEHAERRLGDIVAAIGRTTVAGHDDIWTLPPGVWARRGLAGSVVPLVIGEVVRDWAISECPEILYPYRSRGGDVVPKSHILTRVLWPWRRLLETRTVFGKEMKATGRPWWEHLEHYGDKLETPLSITFAEVATHNHFVLDRGGKVFKQTAPIIKLAPSATEDDYIALVAYLNSSTACFYLRQVAHQKQMMGADSIRHSDPTTVTFAFNAGAVSSLPLPPLNRESQSILADFARGIESLVSETERLHSRLAACQTPSQLAEAESRRLALLSKMVGLQEELDWYVYRLFELVPLEMAGAVDHADSYLPGGRPFEVLKRVDCLAESTIDGFPILDPTMLDADCKRSARMGFLQKGPTIRLLEQSQFKRRWIGRQGRFNHAKGGWADKWRELEESARMDAVEASLRVASRVSTLDERSDASDPDAQLVASAELARENAVPYLSAYCFSEAGLLRHAEWQHTWDLQRREDAGETIAHIPVPPKYAQTDYRGTSTWQLRGPLDVPKERFISYPGCESDQSPDDPIYGWAGWDHEQRAKALATLYWNRKTEESWPKDRLTPMLAGLLELLPWLTQWHNTPSDDYAGDSPANYYAGFLDTECRTYGLTQDDLRNWRPPEKTRGKKASAKATPAPVAGTEGPADVQAKPPRKPRAKKTPTNGEAP